MLVRGNAHYPLQADSPNVSGSAFPATLAFQIREIEKQTGGDLKLDSIVTIIDAENFVGYEDQSPTARMQASYTDIILIVSLLTRFSRFIAKIA